MKWKKLTGEPKSVGVNAMALVEVGPAIPEPLARRKYSDISRR